MNLSDIFTLSGKSGLFTIAGQTKNNVIVESLIDGKKFPTFASNKLSALKDISIFTTEGETSLSEIYKTIYNKEDGKECISHSESADDLRLYLEKILPNYDKDQVYNSDIKKLFMWYNILHKADKLILSEEDNTTKKSNTDKQEEKTETTIDNTEKIKQND
jgi:hypothetical protein